MELDNIHFTVCVHCTTYNHKGFITDALDGFCMQTTTSPFVCVIIDDASTDGESEVIKEYLREHFDCSEVNSYEETEDYQFSFARHKQNVNCFFAVYLLKYNHYQLRKPKVVYYQLWDDRSQYIALCEGDDYWISPDKLQKQIDFLNSNKEYVMTCSRTYLYSVREQKIVGENYCYQKSKVISIKDTIYRTGLFISTCSIVYRKEIVENRPDYWKQCRVGDYPLQIACVLEGLSWFFNEAMAVYRIDNSSSWTGSQEWGIKGGDPKKLIIIQSQVRMFEGFGKDYPKYHSLLFNKTAEHINKNIPLRRFGADKINSYLSNFTEEIKHYNLRWKIDLLCRKTSLPYIRTVYQILFTRQFLVRNKMYK